MTGEPLGHQAPQPFISADVLAQWDIPLHVAEQTSAYAVGWADRVIAADTNDVPVLLAELELTLAQGQAEHPDSLAWDVTRARLAAEVFSRGNMAVSYDITHTIRSPHQTAEVILWYMQQAPTDEVDQQRGLLFFMRGRYQENTPHLRAVMQALLDRVITIDPSMTGAQAIEDLLRRDTPGEYDLLTAWTESQSQARPHHDWEGLGALVGSEGWDDMPIRNRIHIVMRYLEAVEAMNTDPDSAGPEIAGLAQSLTTQATYFPNCGALLAFQPEVAVMCLNNGYLERALDIVRGIQDSETLERLAPIFAERGVDIYLARQTPPDADEPTP